MKGFITYIKRSKSDFPKEKCVTEDLTAKKLSRLKSTSSLINDTYKKHLEIHRVNARLSKCS